MKYLVESFERIKDDADQLVGIRITIIAIHPGGQQNEMPYRLSDEEFTAFQADKDSINSVAVKVAALAAVDLERQMATIPFESDEQLKASISINPAAVDAEIQKLKGK